MAVALGCATSMGDPDFLVRAVWLTDDCDGHLGQHQTRVSEQYCLRQSQHLHCLMPISCQLLCLKMLKFPTVLRDEVAGTGEWGPT